MLLLNIKQFPNAACGNHKQTSDYDPIYNCIAWSINYKLRNIWPDDDFQLGWPQKIDRKPTVENFVKFYEMMGFQLCPNAKVELEYDKIALYKTAQGVEHAARQCADGQWSSKLS